LSRKKSKGAALVEFVLLVPVVILIWVGLFKLNSLYVIKQKTAVAVRYGAWLDRAGVSGALLEARLREELSTCKLIKNQNCIITGLTKDIKPIYRDKEGELTIRYKTDPSPGFATLLLKEKFSIGHNSWITSPKKDRKLDMLKDKTNPKWQDIFF